MKPRWRLHSLSRMGRQAMPKPDLGKAIDWGQAHATTQEADPFKKRTAFDEGSVIWPFENGQVGLLVLSQASVLRKGFASDWNFTGQPGRWVWTGSTVACCWPPRTADGSLRNNFQLRCWQPLRHARFPDAATADSGHARRAFQSRGRVSRAVIDRRGRCIRMQRDQGRRLIKSLLFKNPGLFYSE